MVAKSSVNWVKEKCLNRLFLWEGIGTDLSISTWPTKPNFNKGDGLGSKKLFWNMASTFEIGSSEVDFLDLLYPSAFYTWLSDIVTLSKACNPQEKKIYWNH